MEWRCALCSIYFAGCLVPASSSYSAQVCHAAPAVVYPPWYFQLFCSCPTVRTPDGDASDAAAMRQERIIRGLTENL